VIRATRSIRTGKVLAAAVAMSALASAPAHAAGKTYVITQREGKSQSVITLAAPGMRYDAVAPAARGGRAKPLVGMIIRYSDAHLFLLDPERKLFDSVSLAGALTSYQAEMRAAQAGQPSEKLPPRPGSAPQQGQAPLTLPAAKLRLLRQSKRIASVNARAYLLRDGQVSQRLWYAAGLPKPPARVRALLAKGLNGTGPGFAKALSSHAGLVPLQIDERRGKRWHTVLRTTSIRRRPLSARTLKPPSGYKERNLLAPTTTPAARSRVHAADVPAGPIRCGILITDPISCTVGGPLTGPVSGHPDIWALYWGTRFNDHKDFVSSMNHSLENFVGDQFADPNSDKFWGPLGQYGVGKGRFLGYSIVNENPDDSVGSWNFFDIDWLVLANRYGSDAPNYWWRYNDHDPIFAIFVDQDQVDSSGWAGYHFFTPTEAVFLSFLMHPNMPWFIVKVPSVASIPHDRGSAPYLNAVDTASKRASHEFVEAATDPYPFISWADPLKQPIWEQGEIGDICSQGNTNPWGKAARVNKFGTAFSTYWSNDDQACVPDSRPSARLAYPDDGGTYTWKSDVTFIAQTDDLYDGTVSDQHIHWQSDKDGFDIGRGYIFTTNKLSPGTHHISAFVENSAGGSRYAGPITVNIVVRPPAVKINAPADGTAFGSDETINYRGTAQDPQDGDIGPAATWTVDGGPPVCTGAALCPFRIPTQGAHTVTLTATNSGGLTSHYSIKVNVGPATGKPSVAITEPADGASVGLNEQTTFKGSASAPGGATIPESGYVWTDDIDGQIGTGHEIQHTLSGFSCYSQTHHVTLTVTDSFNRTNADHITVAVTQIC
jgi:hypothetical protein